MRKKLWERWKRIAKAIGDFQARLILSAVYFVIIGPFALVLRWAAGGKAPRARGRSPSRRQGHWMVAGEIRMGPRALGSRSILADPRRADMKDIVNVKIKFREPFRPFAPSVLSERAQDYFELDNAAAHYPARFMLYVVNVKESKRELIPAITHVDGTGRLQTVQKESNPKYYRLIETFGQATGVPIVLNTSFNLKGEPIVNSPQEAFHTFTRSGMDMLVLGNYLIDKSALTS